MRYINVAKAKRTVQRVLDFDEVVFFSAGVEERSQQSKS